ncbi:hypothetical protein F0562_017297 [Nyssa sinensis]|uniref:Secreted protein n=1 Tax=Nyssa sinensis TaxID=561372 RepID=A0A5J4ZE93_9ASTE|nr:hypothetical protein F0562_017297 [Nyssa sinensis]
MLIFFSFFVFLLILLPKQPSSKKRFDKFSWWGCCTLFLVTTVNEDWLAWITILEINLAESDEKKLGWQRTRKSLILGSNIKNHTN